MGLSDPRSDQQLVAAANGGDESAFAAIYYRYRPWVARLAFRFTGNEQDALDVLQESFTYLLRKFPGFELTACMTTFLYPAVRNLSIAARRARGRHHSDEELLAAAPAPPGPRAGERADLSAVMSGLPAAQREVLLMRFVDGMSLEEIAAALDVPVGTVKSRLHNSIAALRDDPRTRSYFF